MFLENKYTKWYTTIINRSKIRVLVGPKERHHIIPKSIGGGNEDANMADLTPREHLVCHLLLTKMVTGVHLHKMLYAAHAMIYFRNGRTEVKVTSRMYEQLRIQWMNMQSMTRSGPGNHFYNKTHSAETRAQLSMLASRPKSEKWKLSASLNRTGENNSFFGKAHSEEQIAKWRTDLRRSHVGEKNGFYGKQHSESQREKKRQEKLSAVKQTCPHCSKVIDAMNFARWHGEKCKMKGKL